MLTVTEAAMRSFATASDPRMAEVMALLVKHLHAFVDESKLTKEEWMRGLTFLTAAADITTEERNELLTLLFALSAIKKPDLCSLKNGSTYRVVSDSNGQEIEEFVFDFDEGFN